MSPDSRSTFCTTYTGVAWPSSLPMIDAQDKKGIMSAPDVTALTPKKWSRSGPQRDSTILAREQVDSLVEAS